MITQQQLMLIHERLCEEARRLMKNKNNDYSSANDPLANFRGSIAFNVDPRIGILLRMQDKMVRIASFTEKGFFAVQNEGAKDSLMDIINYAVLLMALIDENMRTLTSEHGSTN